jgi:hypothetical protein
MLSVSERLADYATKFVTGDGISDGFCRNGHTQPRAVGGSPADD